MIKSYKGGYTIIETMMAVSLFLVIIMTGMGALLNANLLHQKSRDLRSITDSLSFIMEDMSKNLRTGYNYRCLTGNDDLSLLSTPKSGQNCWGIAFETANGSTSNNNDQWVYYVSNTGKIYKAVQAPYTDPTIDSASSFVQLNPDQVLVTSQVSGAQVSGFSVTGAEPRSGGDFQQPLATIKISGTITFNNVTTPFSLQTSVSERLIDN